MFSPIDEVLHGKKEVTITFRSTEAQEELLEQLALRTGKTKSFICHSLIAYGIKRQLEKRLPGPRIPKPFVVDLGEVLNEMEKHLETGTWTHMSRQRAAQKLAHVISIMLDEAAVA